MIEEILPPEVAAVEAFEDVPDVALFPEEEAAVAKAAGSRRREFATARLPMICRMLEMVAGAGG